MTINDAYKKTKKLYYEDPYLTQCSAVIRKINKRKTGMAIQLDKTVAYCEGGGQLGDTGYIIAHDGTKIKFIDSERGIGRPLYIENFPNITVDNIIHHILENDIEAEKFKIGDTVTIMIDIERRARLSTGHTASHLVYIAIQKIKKDAKIIGFSLSEHSARFDFTIEERFTKENLDAIQNMANSWVSKNSIITQYTHPDEPEALYWCCDDATMPCGGTHLDRTGGVDSITLKRKNIGKGKDRIILTFNQTPDLSLYHNGS